MAASTPEQKQAAVEAAYSELKFLLTREGVSEELGVQLYHVGITSVKQFAAFAKSTEDLRAAAKELGVDSDKDMASRAMVTKFLVTRNSAQARADKLAAVERGGRGSWGTYSAPG